MDESFTLDVELKKPISIPGLDEDDLRLLAANLVVRVLKNELQRIVTSQNGIETTFVFGPDGNFSGVNAKINGKNIAIIPGIGSGELHIFKGAPSTAVPGPGWEVEVELTQQYLSQSTDQTTWKLFFASRSQIINTV